jgi:poly [ADP-ribose] polymerase
MTKVCRLILVEVNNNPKKGVAKQSNKFYNMEDSGTGVINVEYGRVDKTCTKITQPTSKWDSIIKSKVKKGYKDITHLVAEVEEGEGDSPAELAQIADSVINTLFAQLQAFANKTITESYKVSAHKVTQMMVDEAQAKVDEIAVHLAGPQTNKAVNKFNDLLIDLFHIIPRKMEDVSAWLVDTKLEDDAMLERCKNLLGKEQSTLDVMAGQVVVNTKTDEDKEITVEVKKNILDALGLTAKAATATDIASIKKLMGDSNHKFKKAYKVVNKNTQKMFDTHMKTVQDNTTELFWHGSRNENWLNILSTGLLIRPSGAVYSGSMFGDGIYFADKAQKSIGYSSLRGSHWTGGKANTGYLALFSVHVGRQKNITRHNSSCYSLNARKLQDEGTDSVFAHGGADLRNNEYIVYTPQQTTVSFLVEIG